MGHGRTGLTPATRWPICSSASRRCCSPWRWPTRSRASPGPWWPKVVSTALSQPLLERAASGEAVSDATMANTRHGQIVDGDGAGKTSAWRQALTSAGRWCGPDQADLHKGLRHGERRDHRPDTYCHLTISPDEGTVLACIRRGVHTCPLRPPGALVGRRSPNSV